VGVLDEMMEGVEQPAKEKTLWEKTKETISNIPGDVKTSAKDYVSGAKQGYQELVRQGDTLAETNPLALSGTPMQEGVTNAPAPEQTEEQQYASEQYQEASNQFMEGTVKPPLLPAALAGNTVAGILYSPFMVSDAIKSYDEAGGGIEGVGKVARDFTYGGAVDFASQPELASQFQARPVQTTVNGILSIAPPLLMGVGASKVVRRSTNKPSATEGTTPVE